MKSPHTSYGLVRNDVMLDMLAKIPFENQNYSQPLECIVQIHKDEGDCVEGDTSGSSISINNAYVQEMISSSSLPRIVDAFTFAPPTTELLNALNTDFRLCPSLLHAVAILHTGSLITTTDNAVLTLTAEAYARAKCLDSHDETNMKSLPSSTSLFPNLLSVGIHEEADGGAAKMKLKIGSKTINVLITMSSLIKKNKVFVGPETPISTGFHNYAVFYETTKQKNFMAAVKNFFDGDQDIYHQDSERHALLQPATIFTIADLPSNQGYGISDTSIAKTASNILQCVAIAVMLRKPLSNEEIKNVIDQYAPKNQQNPAIVALLAHLNTRVTRNPLNIATFLSSISTHAHNSLSVANRKISDNVEVKLMKLFGSGL